MAAALVQEVASYDTDAVLPGDVTAGNILTVAQFATFTPGASSKVSGSATISLVTSVTGTLGRVDIWEVTGSGSLTMTGQDYVYLAQEWSGVDTADVLEDSDVAEISSGTAVDTGPLTLAANCLVIMYVGRWLGGNSFTPDAGYTAAGVSTWMAYGCYDLDAATGATPGGDCSGSSDYTAITIALNVEAGGASPARVMLL